MAYICISDTPHNYLHENPQYVCLQVTTTVENLRNEANTRRESPLADSTCLRYTEDVDAPMSFGTQFEIARRCKQQDWGSVFCRVDYGEDKGRGLVALQRISKDDIVVDYHGKVIYLDIHMILLSKCNY